MIYSLSGKLVHTESDLAVIECAGVGYACKTTFSTLQQIAGKSEVKLYTHLAVKEDAVELFGFATQEELKSFRMLISVSGVGPKQALPYFQPALRHSSHWRWQQGIQKLSQR